MSVFSRENYGRDYSIKQGAFTLTQQGREKLQSAFDGSPNARVLVSLETNSGSMSIDELSRETGITTGHIEHILRVLLKRNYVQEVHSGMLE